MTMAMNRRRHEDRETISQDHPLKSKPSECTAFSGHMLIIAEFRRCDRRHGVPIRLLYQRHEWSGDLGLGRAKLTGSGAQKSSR